jgi:hypothetical protein
VPWSYCLHDIQQLICDSRVASFLQDCGFDGIIQSADVQRRDSVAARKHDDPPPHVEDGAFRWPQYKRLPKTEIVYPVGLEATSPEQFRLSLPNPAIRHTNNLLYLYSRRNPHLRLMISLLYVWMRSWDVKQISPKTLYLLLIRYLQVWLSSAFPNSYFADTDIGRRGINAHGRRTPDFTPN